MSRTITILTALALLVAAAQSATTETQPQTGTAPASQDATPGGADELEAESPAANLAVAKAIAPSFVRVEYTLQYDKGESPSGGGWRQRYPTFGRYRSFGTETVIQEERPLEMPGFVLSPTRVASPDLMIHPRFIKKVAVRCGDQTVEAKLAMVAKAQSAVFLDLSKPLQKARPLVFKPKAERPYKTVTYARVDAAWTVSVASLGASVSETEWGRRFLRVPWYCVITAKDGTPVGLSMNDELPLDDSWKGSPQAWPAYSAKEMDTILEAIQKRTDAGLLRVSLSFRSPKKRPGAGRFVAYEEDEEKTERNVLGVLVDKETLLVLASLRPKITARLERIRAYGQDGQAVEAQFQHSLKDYGGFVAKLKTPLERSVTFAKKKITDRYRVMLPAAEIRLQGEKKVVYYQRSRIVGFEIGWRRKIFPELAGRSGGLFVFDPSGALVALPVARRPKASLGDRWRGGAAPVLTPVAHLKGVLDDLANNIDPSNVPLTEEEESRLAWLGLELQPLNRELARANKVSHLTRDGSTGCLVSYVYPDSPAGKAGVKVQWILLRLHVPDRPKPIEVELPEYGRFGGRGFPWELMDRIPEEAFDRLPTPWPPAENAFTRTLTDLGFGKGFEAEFFVDGQVLRKKFTVVASPTHYDSAQRHKDKALGLTVADLTYEVRRYFQKKAGDPGVIAAKVEPGSKASVSGLKPFEVITHVNDEAVHNVKEFEKIVAGKTELRLAVKRMMRGRVVKIRLDEKAPATGPATMSAPSQPAP